MPAQDKYLPEKRRARLRFRHRGIEECFLKRNRQARRCILQGRFGGLRFEDYMPDMDDDKGTSAVVVHTEKGLACLKEISKNCDLEFAETTIDNILSFDNSYVRKVRDNPQRHKFLVECGKTDDINVLIESNIYISRMRKYKNKAIKLGNRVFEKFIKSESCVGCTACANVCRQDAIKMKQDQGGFYYPEVDFSKCIGCKMCVKACPAKSERLVQIRRNNNV